MIVAAAECLWPETSITCDAWRVLAVTQAVTQAVTHAVARAAPRGLGDRNMNVGRIVLASLLAGALLGAGAVMIAYRSWHATEQVEQSVTGPDSAHIARVISVHEPGVAGRRYVVVRVGRIGAGGKPADDSGVVWLENPRGVRVQWTGPKQLVVQYAGNAFVEGKVPRVGDVRVTYLSVDSLTVIPLPARDTTRHTTRPVVRDTVRDTAHPAHRTAAARTHAAAR